METITNRVTVKTPRVTKLANTVKDTDRKLRLSAIGFNRYQEQAGWWRGTGKDLSIVVNRRQETGNNTRNIMKDNFGIVVFIKIGLPGVGEANLTPLTIPL